MKNLGYLECQRGGYHSGEFINMVCLNPGCKNDPLCCCACVQEHHVNHKTKTLKKLLLDAEVLTKSFKQQQKQELSFKNKFNTDIMQSMVENQEKIIIMKIQELKVNLMKQIDNLEAGIHTYFNLLHQQLGHKGQNNKNPKLEVLESIQMVQGSSNIQSLKTATIKLIQNVNSLQKLINHQGSQNQSSDQEGFLNFLKNSNDDISDMVQIRVQDLFFKLTKETKKMEEINSKINFFWQTKLYKFSQNLHHSSIQLVSPFKIKATIDSIYQMALMSPALNFQNETETFTFRINANDLDWVGLGVCYKKIAQKNDFKFNYNNEGHGCYMVSGNAGVWSHSNPDFNNFVKAFKFRPGDSVTCVVNKNKICFFKNVSPELQETLQYSQKEYYQLEIHEEPGDFLHPCVVCFYYNTEIEYLPSFKSTKLHLPNYRYKFNQKTKHDSLIILDDIHLIGCSPTSYKSCILNQPMQSNEQPNKLNSVTFNIVKSTGNWIGVGVCHKSIVISKKYDFYFESTGHGCYMISANGGSWSNTNPHENNIIKTFKFLEGDLVTVTLDQKNLKVLFKKGLDKYELKYKPIAGDQLYPIIVLYYQNDEVDVLPDL